MIPQPIGGSQGQASDIEIYTKEILTLRTELNNILTRHTSQPLEKIEHDTDRNFFMSAEEAKAYRIVDKVITKLDPLKERKPVPAPVG
jgi:ATP-dependent Clp protease protease subunit